MEYIVTITDLRTTPPTDIAGPISAPSYAQALLYIKMQSMVDVEYKIYMVDVETGERMLCTAPIRIPVAV